METPSALLESLRSRIAKLEADLAFAQHEVKNQAARAERAEKKLAAIRDDECPNVKKDAEGNLRCSKVQWAGAAADIDLRAYLVAHAPEIPLWFERKKWTKRVTVPAPEMGPTHVKFEDSKCYESCMEHLIRWRNEYADAMLAACNAKT